VLLLDEPTNDLDTDTLASLEDLLDSWPGTLIVASHDRYLVERVTDSVYALFGDGRLIHLPGGVDEYLSRISGTMPGGPATLGGPTLAGRAGAGGPALTGTGGEGSAGAGLSAAELRSGRKDLNRLERQVGRLEDREASLHEQLAQNATDYEKVAALDAELRTVRAERAQTEEDWLALAERLGDG
jgi:ATP-binding cassette subfamily F protein uup